MRRRGTGSAARRCRRRAYRVPISPPQRRGCRFVRLKSPLDNVLVLFNRRRPLAWAGGRRARGAVLFGHVDRIRSCGAQPSLPCMSHGCRRDRASLAPHRESQEKPSCALRKANKSQGRPRAEAKESQGADCEKPRKANGSQGSPRRPRFPRSAARPCRRLSICSGPPRRRTGFHRHSAGRSGHSRGRNDAECPAMRGNAGVFPNPGKSGPFARAQSGRRACLRMSTNVYVC